MLLILQNMNRPERNKPLIKTGWLRAVFYFLAIILGLAIVLLVFSITQFKGSVGSWNYSSLFVGC